MRQFLIALAVAAAMLSVAQAQVWIMSPSGHIPPWGAGKHSSGPPPTCAGVVDFSVGCALPMFRGIP